jgi:peroxiredoxin
MKAMTKDDTMAGIGRPAPEFSLDSADGATVSLASLRGRHAVLFFVREFT